METPTDWQTLIAPLVFATLSNLTSFATILICYQDQSRIFRVFFTIQIIVAVAAEVTFAALSFTIGKDWPLYLLISIVLLTMVRECLLAGSSGSPGMRSFSLYPLVIMLAVTSAFFLGGNILESKLPILPLILQTSAAVSYRLWMVWVWARIAQDTSTNKMSIMLHLQLRILAFGASVSGVPSILQIHRLLVFANTFAIHDSLTSLASLIRPSFGRWRNLTS
ncbi:hypothetical protein B0H63DRAFT_490544 [Podospora didyma]|uniref:Uncharacterized protein n=1 Tax=Podospora didyma TaxID=330526 RepID=A0AAE0JYU2_9PEZI|nr:hypothetical protein B0H63DRAFT_490544 [Podospora didyma]